MEGTRVAKRGHGADPDTEAPAAERAASERLDSWQEIAAYLRREIRTLQRWGKTEGLPVHRHIHGKMGTVYAYKAELDIWWNNGHGRLATEAVAAPAVTSG